MPNDFKRVLEIDAEGRIVPAGNCEINAGEEARLYAWVVQSNHDGTAAICSGFQDEFPVLDSWEARADAYHAGRFRSGQALATAVLVRRDQGDAPENPKVHWWSEMVVLQE